MVNHPVFSWVYSKLGALDRSALGPHREIIASCLRGRVLEIGCGTGFNFAFYRSGAEVTAIEPDHGMLKHARVAAANSPVPIIVIEGDSEKLDFPAGSFDYVVSALVLCTVANPDLALNEIRRVLKPGGSLVFLEHVESASRSWRRMQRFLNPVWQRIAGGCQLCRDTKAKIIHAGFVIESCESIGNLGWPLLPAIRGVAKN